MTTLNNQVFADGSTYYRALKTTAHAIVDTKYNLENAEFDEGRFLNQEGWWLYLEDMV